jgi:hypothetical protein
MIHPAPAELEDARRSDRLISLLAIGVERLLAARGKETPESLDFTTGVLPNTCAGRKQRAQKKN